MDSIMPMLLLLESSDMPIDSIMPMLLLLESSDMPMDSIMPMLLLLESSDMPIDAPMPMPTFASCSPAGTMQATSWGFMHMTGFLSSRSMPISRRRSKLP